AARPSRRSPRWSDWSCGRGGYGTRPICGRRSATAREWKPAMPSGRIPTSCPPPKTWTILLGSPNRRPAVPTRSTRRRTSFSTTVTTTPEPHITDKLRSDAITVLSAWPAPNPRQEGLRHRYLRYLSEHRDAMWRSCSPDHLTASALIVSADRRHVLLTLHARAKRWLQTGGHCEAGDDTLAAAAMREAREESGIDALTIGSTPVLLSRHAVPFCGP